VIVVDASVAVALVADAGAFGDVAREHLGAAGGEAAAPYLVDAEVGQVVRRLVRAGTLSPREAEGALANLAALPIERFPHLPLMRDALSLGDNLTFHDALYVVLAKALGARVVTADRRLAAAPGVAPHVQLLAVT